MAEASPIPQPGTRTAPVHALASDGHWWLTPPAPLPIDASGIVRLPDGTFLLANDKGLPLWEIRLDTPPTASLHPRPDLFPMEQVGPWVRNSALPDSHLDLEGLALDGDGGLYVCEEGRRWVLRHDLATGQATRLEIDWGPGRRWFHPTDRNASLEGIAVSPRHLYLANERDEPRILVLDRTSLRWVDDFAVFPDGKAGGKVHYSDLCWTEDRLWVLCRARQCILEVDPALKQVVAQYDYRSVEREKDKAYATVIPIGMAEGLWVDATHFWILVDNNGFARRTDRRDRRPLLFRCPRPTPSRE